MITTSGVTPGGIGLAGAAFNATIGQLPGAGAAVSLLSTLTPAVGATLLSEITASLPSPPDPVPGRVIGQHQGVTVLHHGTADAHKPAHAHLHSRGRNVRVGPNGKPLAGQPELNHRERSAVQRFKTELRKEIRKLGRANQRIAAYNQQIRLGRGLTAKGLGILSVAAVTADVAAALFGKPQFAVGLEETYVFLDNGGNAFYAQSTGRFSKSHEKVFIAGPKKGTSAPISSKDFEALKKAAEEVYGKYIPGGLFFEPRFIPGALRDSLPVFDQYGRETGVIDENGFQSHPLPIPRPIWL